MKNQAKVSKKGRQKKAFTGNKSQEEGNPLLPGPDESLPPFTVIYIHGIGNQPDAPVLKINWDKALFGMDMGERTRMAYWSDITHPRPGAGMRSHAVSLMDGNSIENEDLPPFETSELLRTLGPDARKYAQALSKHLIVETNVRTIKANRFESKILPGFIRKPVTEHLTKLLIKDTASYFFDAERKKNMQSRLRRWLVPGGGPYVLVSHSQGSIIAYDVLSALAKEGANVKIPLWITMGSPLGLDEVQDHIAKPLARPGIVKAWKNFADRLDPVALDSQLENEFKPHGGVEDFQVKNPESGLFSGFNPHSAVGYLKTGEVRTVVLNQVGAHFPQLIHRFVIARDVVKEMSIPDSRVPVLFELDDSVAGGTLVEKGKALAETIQAILGDPAKVEKACIETLRRFVSAKLTGEEIDQLAYNHRSLKFSSVWKNSAKKALIDQSCFTVQASTAWAGYNALGQGIAWAVLDTGIHSGHPHFKGSIVSEWDCTKPGALKNGVPAKDGNGHGTHVAGIIAGKSADGKMSGMAPECKLHIYKVLDDGGNGEDAWIIKALDHIAEVNDSSPELKIHGLNLSLGGSFDATVFGCGHSPLCRELRRLWRQGVVVCIAAGNEGRLAVDTPSGEVELNSDLSIGDPANLEEAIAVGSVNKAQPHTYGISYFSSKGPTSDGRMKPDVVAPGERILSCNHEHKAKGTQPAYVAMSGTSMACPHVSGILAGFLSVRKEFIGYPDKVKEILMVHCTDLKRDKYHQGSGLPNLTKMLVAT